MDAAAVVAGTIIGFAIFLLPSAIAAQIPSLRAVLLVWVAGGLLTVFGALSLAELGGMYPGAGAPPPTANRTAIPRTRISVGVAALLRSVARTGGQHLRARARGCAHRNQPDRARSSGVCRRQAAGGAPVMRRTQRVMCA